MDILHTRATRYVLPLREGGSLPAVVDTDRDGMFVVKFRGAGQGPRALVAELVVGLLATALELPVPELAVVEVPPPLGRSEPDPEIQDILRGSHGANVGLRYLDGAFNFDLLAAGELVTGGFAADLVWFDALVTNPDRTARNPNLLVHDRALRLIDHGAALYAHHRWDAVDEARMRAPFPLIRDHVLLARADDPGEADERLAFRVDEALVRSVMAAVPDDLLTGAVGEEGDAASVRERYVAYLLTRVEGRRDWVDEARKAWRLRRSHVPARLESRR